MRYSKVVDKPSPCAQGLLGKYKGIKRRARLDKNRGFVFYRLHNRNTEELKESIIDDISVKGLSFAAPEPIEPGAILECEIYQPIGSQKNIIVSISIKALVVSIKEIDNSTEFSSNKYRLGLKFIKIFPTNKDKIVKSIAIKK